MAIYYTPDLRSIGDRELPFIFNRSTLHFTGGLPSPLALLVSGNDVFIEIATSGVALLAMTLIIIFQALACIFGGIAL